MTDDFTELDGVGSARQEKLIKQGYETYEELSKADHETLAENINRLSSDTALELVVQAQNITSLEQATVEKTETTEQTKTTESDSTHSKEESVHTEAEDTVIQNPTPTPPFSVTIEFDTVSQYHSFYHAVIEGRCTAERTNRESVSMYNSVLKKLANGTTDDTFTFTLDKGELNNLHSAVVQQKTHYQKNNLVEYMNSLREIEVMLNNMREEFLF